MAVGGFLDGKVMPIGGLVVRPHNHAAEQIFLILRHTAEDTVDHRHGLRTGDVVVRTERAVWITCDPTQSCGPLDLRFGPVTGNVGKVIVAVGLLRVETG